MEDNRGRRERRTLVSREVTPAQMNFPHAAQVARLERTRDLRAPQRQPEVVWLLSSLSVEQAGEQRLLELARAYWGIENGGHGRLDGSAFEDGCRVRHPVAATALGWLRRFVHGQYAAWSHQQKRARDRTQPTFFAHYRAHPATAIRFLTSMNAGP